MVGVQLSVSGGAGFATSRGAVDAELLRAGWPALPSVSLAGQIRFGFSLFDESIDAHFGWSDVSLPGSAGSAGDLEDHRGAIGVTVGHRLRFGRVLSLSPYVGIESLRSILCFAGHPSSASLISRPPFEQILGNPGRRTCLGASSVGLDVGLSFAGNLRLALEERSTGSMVAYLSIGPRVGYTLPLSSGQTWTTISSVLKTDIPPFEGPSAPLGGAYAGIEIQLRFAAEVPSAGSS